MTNESLERLTEKVLKFALEKYEGIFSPKNLIDNGILKNYQEWSRVLKKLKSEGNYEIKEIEKDELRIYNRQLLGKRLSLSDGREKFYSIVNQIEKKKFKTFIKLIKDENTFDKKIELIKMIIDPSRNFVDHLTYVTLSDIEFLLKEFSSILKNNNDIYNKEFLGKLYETYLTSFFTKCGEIFNLKNEIRGEISNFVFERFKKEKEEYFKNQTSEINEDNILQLYKVYLIISPKEVQKSDNDKSQFTKSPKINTILEWGEEDWENLENTDNYNKNKFINFYSKLLICHMKNIDEKELIKQKLELNYEEIIKNGINAKPGNEKEFYSLFENLDNLYNKEEILNKFR